MNAIPSIIEPAVDGETRAVVMIGFSRVSQDAIVDFADARDPGLTYRAVVYGITPEGPHGGLEMGGEYRLMFHESRGLARPATWIFLGRPEEKGPVGSRTNEHRPAPQ